MCKKITALLLVFVLVFSLAVSASAESRGRILLKKVISALGGEEEESTGEHLPEKLVRKLVTSLKEKAADHNDPVYQIASKLLSKLKITDGKIDFSKLGSLGSLFGGEGSSPDLDTLYKEYLESDEYKNRTAQLDAIKAHVMEEYKDEYDPDDVHLFSYTIAHETEEKDGQITFLGYFSVTDYKPDGTDLKMKFFTGNVELVTVTKDEAAGTYSVTEAVKAKEGELYWPSVQAMCEKIGTTEDEFNETMLLRDWGMAYDMAQFLKGSTEYKRIEYQGELKTAEEMDAVAGELLDAALAEWPDKEQEK